MAVLRLVVTMARRRRIAASRERSLGRSASLRVASRLTWSAAAISPVVYPDTRPTATTLARVRVSLAARPVRDGSEQVANRAADTTAEMPASRTYSLSINAGPEPGRPAALHASRGR